MNNGAGHPKGCPIPSCEGVTGVDLATLTQPYKVALVGEAPGEDEVKFGKPFSGRAGFKLNRLIEFAGLDRKGFDIWNVCWCRPPANKLEGTSYEYGAVEYWRPSWTPLLDRVDVVVPMGNVPLHAFIGEKGILRRRGYIYPSPTGWQHVLPTVHPAFILRGQSKYSAAFIHDIQRAVELGRNGLVPELTHYALDPSPAEALEWARTYRKILDDSSRESTVSGVGYQNDGGVSKSGGSRDDAKPKIYLSFDIETPGKGDDEGELDADDPTYFIWRIGFSYDPLNALSIPWTPEYLPAIRLLLDSYGDKIVWNKEFDVPRIRHNGVEINGTIHDGMVAWHILHSDLPKGLGFVATFTCPNQPAWKHLSKQSPAFYNATDADVELRSFLSIEKDLRSSGLWSVYQKDVIDLEPILQLMQKAGMPIDPVIREDRARKLATRLTDVTSGMSATVPLAARRIDQVYVNTPKSLDGLYSRPATRRVKTCSACGAVKPRKDHFKRFVKKVNPCADGVITEVEQAVEEYYRLADFTPSRDQLMRYHTFLGRPFPTEWDKKEQKKKVTFNEKALKKLTAKYPDDILYKLILQHRELQKIAGTYIGRWED